MVYGKCTYIASAGDIRSHHRLKGRTAYAVRRELTGACVRARMRGHLWSPSYFTVSCTGAPPSITKQHIDGQARPL
jgi:putative transposase